MQRKERKMKKKSIIFFVMVLSILFSAMTSSCIVNADELDGYTKVDWEWNRDIETTEDNSVIVGGNIVFWRYVNKDKPAENNAIWRSDFGNELTDDEVTAIWNDELPPKYIIASVDVENIPDESIRNYIYNHIDEDLPHLKFKFDIDADVEGRSNKDKAEQLFNGDVGYQARRDDEGGVVIEMKFSPKFHLIDEYNIYNPDTLLPNMPNKVLPRARYPYSSVVFSMWGNNDENTNVHYGALEVVEENDPNYVYGKSFGYGDISEKGKITKDKKYPNFEAGQENPEGDTIGQFEDAVLDSNDIRIGKQYKLDGDLWYYTYGGAVGYNFKFPFKVSLELDLYGSVIKRYVNSNTGEVIFEDEDALSFGGEKTINKMYTFATNSGKALIGDNETEYKYERYEVRKNEEVTDDGTAKSINLVLSEDAPQRILYVYVIPNNTVPTKTPAPQEDDDIDTVPIAPPICDSPTSTIEWQEQTKHTAYDNDGGRHTCYHTYTYEATLKVDSITLSPDPIKSGYGLDAEIKTSVSYEQTNATKSYSCSHRLGTHTPSNKPKSPTKVTARLGWTSETFDGEYIQGSMVDMVKKSGGNTWATFVPPDNAVTGENKIYTDLWLSGTGQEPKRHKIAFDIYGGGVNGTEWCTTVEQTFVINGDMYEDAITTSTYN